MNVKQEINLYCSCLLRKLLKFTVSGLLSIAYETTRMLSAITLDLYKRFSIGLLKDQFYAPEFITFT